MDFSSTLETSHVLKGIVFLVIIYGMNNHFIVQLKLLHPVQCMAFAKLSLVEISKAKHNAAFSCRVPLGACDRAGEEEILFKNPRDFWRFLHSADIFRCSFMRTCKKWEKHYGNENNKWRIRVLLKRPRSERNFRRTAKMSCI